MLLPRLYNGKDNCFSLIGFWQRLSELANTAFRKKLWKIVDIRYSSFDPQTILKVDIAVKELKIKEVKYFVFPNYIFSNSYMYQASMGGLHLSWGISILSFGFNKITLCMQLYAWEKQPTGPRDSALKTLKGKMS